MTNFTVRTVLDGLALNNAKPSADSYNFECIHAAANERLCLFLKTSLIGFAQA